MTRQAKFEVPLHVWPFAGKDAVHNTIAHRPIAAHPMVAKNSIFFCSQRFDGTLGSKVEIVCAQSNDFTSECFKRMSE